MWSDRVYNTIKNYDYNMSESRHNVKSQGDTHRDKTSIKVLHPSQIVSHINNFT